MKRKIDYYKLQRAKGFNEFDKEIRDRVNSDFNFINLEVIKKVFNNCEFEQIETPSEEILFIEWWEDLSQDEQDEKEQQYKIDNQTTKIEEGDLKKWLKEQYSDEIQEHYQERENYPMWATLFEARDEILSNKTRDLADKLYSVLGLGVMCGGDNFNNFIFMSSAGHSFYLDYWYSLYAEIFEWVDVNKYFSKKDIKEASK